MPLRPGVAIHYGQEWRLVHRPPILARSSVPLSDARGVLDQLSGVLEPERLTSAGEALSKLDGEAVARCECLGECGGTHPTGRCPELDRLPALTFTGRVYIQVAHLDQDPRNNTPSNLRALCQACHNRIDAYPRAESRQLRRSLERVQAEAHGPQVRMPFPDFTYGLCRRPEDVRVWPPRRR